MDASPDGALGNVRTTTKPDQREYPVVEGCRTVEVANRDIDVMDGAARLHVALSLPADKRPMVAHLRLRLQATTTGNCGSGTSLLQVLLSNALAQEHVGLEETDDGIWGIWLGTLDERDYRIYA